MMTNRIYSKDVKDTIQQLMDKHIPGAKTDGRIRQFECKASRGDKRKIARLVTKSRITTFIKDFKSYKSPSDEIYPVLLKRCIGKVDEELVRIFKFCLNSGLTPMNWLNVKIIFIPKPGKARYDNPGSFRPISLMSFLFKTLEKISNEGMKEMILKLHRRQYAYREGNCLSKP